MQAVDVMSNVKTVTMKIQLCTLLIFATSLFNCYSQNENIEKLLIEKFPIKNSFIADGLWMFYPDEGNIRKIETKYFKENNPNLELYHANLTNYLDEHTSDSECVIIFDSKLNSIKLIPPLWYQGFSNELFQLFVGIEYRTKSDRRNLAREIQKIIIVGSNMNIGKIINMNNKIVFDVNLSGHKNAWRRITLNFEKNKLIHIQSVNPYDNSLESEVK